MSYSNLIKIVLFNILIAGFVNAQPFLFNYRLLDETSDGLRLCQINKINLSDNTSSPFLTEYEGFYNYFLVPTNDWVGIVYKTCDETRIYNILDTNIYIDLSPEFVCFGGGLQYSSGRNKIYYFEGYDRDLDQLSSIDMLTGEIDSLLIVPTSYNQPIGNLEAFLSSNENVLYFNVMDTTYPLSVNDKDFVHYFSTVTNQLIKTERLYQFGYPNADGYRMHLGRKGKAIVESFFRNETEDCYFRLYDFDNDTGSVFIFFQGNTTPYFTGDGEYLIIPQTIYEAQRLDNTGTFYIYDLENGTLVKTLTLPPNGRIYTFDKYPSNVYYTKDIGLPTQQVWVLKMDSIFNVLDLTSLNPSSAIVNSPPFTLTVYGHGFDSLSTVYFNDTAKTTTYISDSVLTAEISTADTTVIGSYPVWVTDQWGTSDTLYFLVAETPPLFNSIMPSLSYRLPPIGSIFSFDATAEGAFFTDSSVAYFNGQPKPTTRISDSLLTFQVNNSDLESSGTKPVWISNYGSISDTLYFSVVESEIQPIIPILECIEEIGYGYFTAYFGYDNTNEEGVYLPVGRNNMFSGEDLDRGQPVVFLPGRQESVFSLVFDGRELTWHLNGEEVTITEKNDRCE